MNLLRPYSSPGIKNKLQVHNALNTLKLHDVLQSGIGILKTQDARLEAEILLMKATNKDRSELYASLDETILAEQHATFTDFLQQRQKGRPISYITGERCFYNTTLFVDERVLIPRPETEILIEKAMEFLTPLPQADVLDMATGSGAIAVAIGMSFPRATIDATDSSSNALDVAKLNRDRYHLQNRIHLFQSDQFDQVTKSYDLIVSNPPYSIKWEGDSNSLLINDPRFSPAGVLAPKSKADLAFIMHSLAWLATSGTAAIVCFPGILYRGGAEQKIRKYLIDNNFVDSVIQLPNNLFFGTSIATCIMVLKKSKSENKTLFIDASREFIKVTNSNKLTEESIKKIVDAFSERTPIEYFSVLVNNKDIAAQDYNLSVSTYVQQEDTREVIDIKKLNAQIAEIVAHEDVLRKEIDKIIAEIENDENK